ncbi:D-2-hydroxyacid dehydrogenase [Lacticaseibacillus daqingensis]|uniref:D-2-hydroxyacid dehydrogenase n=1 Tax=Lacticaseibacillus daqingensis TaxID=2486014 RepID=UPI000F7A0447|nr:D-2-hydroxyacid dehydrogenase [Lacticaseibacillus daqingensis]
MKVLAYGVRGDEQPYLDQWAQQTGDTLVTTSSYLSAATLTQPADGISCFQTVPYAPSVFAQMQRLGIRYLALRNTGTDNVDFEAAVHYGIRVSNVPAYSPAAIAEFALLDMLYLLRQTGAVQAALHANDYAGAGTHIGRELGESTVGVIGTGRIGQALIRILNGFGAKVLAFDPHPPTDPSLVYTPVTFATLLQHSDIVSLHVPGIPANHHLIDAAALAQMKPGALLINTGRPNLLDTPAVLASLAKGRLGGVGIDTYENETSDLLALANRGHFNDPQWQALLALPNVILSPHIAYYTQTAVRNMVEQSLTNLQSFLAGVPCAAEITATDA